jgi:peptidyl-prolyl cis-trans isomerase SurA
MTAMKRNLSICGFLLMVFAAASAQVASHAPTVFTQAPAQAPATSAPTANKPIVRVNGSILTEADLVREEYAIFPYARQHNGIPKDLTPQVRDGAMKMIVFEELVYQEALRRKMTVPPSKM